MRLDSLAFRLFATSLGWTLLVLPFAGYLIYRTHCDGLQTKFDADLKKLLTAVAFDSMNTTGNEPVVPQNLYEPLFEVTHSGWYWQVRPIDGAPGRRLVSPSLASEILPSPYDKKFPTDVTGTRWMNVPGPSDQRIRILEVIETLGADPAKTKYSVIVAGPMDWLEADFKRFRNWLSGALALAGLALLASTLLQMRFGLAPLRKIERGLANIRSGAASKLAGRLPAEIEPMQAELNALIQSNQEVIDRARTQVGNLAHALKTPLAVITNEAREEKSAFGSKVAEQAQIMRDSVSHYLDRARMAASAGGLGRVTPVEPVVEPLVRALERIHRDKGVTISMTVAPGAKFQGEKQDLEEMLGNVLDNACKWCSKRVFLTVNLETPDAKSKVKRLAVTVDDDGPGLTAEQRAKIGKRGMRLDESKPGTGLGLSIVGDLATSYRGAMSLDASPHGGLRVALDLPGV